MLTLIEGGFSSHARDMLMREVAESVRAGKRSVLIVPEQETLTRESEASLLLPPEAPLCFEVSNFTRFTNTVFRRIGGISGEYCTATERALIMWRALTELAPTLTMTAKRADVPHGTVLRALSAVAEMESLGRTPEELFAAAESLGDKDARLTGKLTDIASVWTLYKRLLHERYSDAGEDLAKLSEMLKAGERDIGIDEIYIDGFTSFTEPQYRLLSELMARVPVTAVLTLPRHRQDSFEYGEVKACETRLLQLATKRGVQKRILRPAAPDAEISGAVSELGALLWRTDGELDPDTAREAAERVRIFSGKTPFEVCDFIAADIKRRAMEGASFSDIAVVARAAGDYVGIIDTALRQAGIPHFISKPSDVSATAGIKLIFTAYAIAARGFRREDVITYLKTGLTGISRRERDRFESYVNKWRIDGARFTDGVAWNMNPRGYEPLSDRDREALIKIGEVRERIISPLLSFSEDTRAAKCVREHAEALVEFLISLGLERRLLSSARALEEAGETAAAEECGRLWGIICSALDKLVDLLGDVPANGESFAAQLAVVFSRESVGRIPAHIDEVTVGSADMLRLNKKRHVYMLGVNRNEFPRAVSDNSFFTDRDKMRLSKFGLDLAPDTEIRCARELYCFSRAFCAGGESVTLLYSETGAASGTLYPAEVLERISQLSKKQIKARKISDLPISERLYTPELAPAVVATAEDGDRLAIMHALRDSDREDLIRAAEARIDNRALSLSADVLEEIYSGDIHLSQSRLDTFLGCPMSYFCRYVLRLSDDEEAELGANIVGSFIHGILEGFFTEVVERGYDLTALTREERVAIIEKSAEEYLRNTLTGATDNARTRVAIKRLSESALPVVDGLCEELSGCSFAPLFFELSTDESDPALPRPVVYFTEDGKKIVIGGQVDRVDTFPHDGNVYVRVIDYKTGRKEFSPEDLAEGYNLQMFLYLKAIVETDTPEFREKIGVGEEGELIPAGVMYVKTNLHDVVVDGYDALSAEEAVKKLQSRDGMVLNDPVSIGAMNADFMPPKPSSRAKKQQPREYDMVGWRELNSTIEEVVKSLVGRMRSGDVSASPKNEKFNRCKNCKYKHICRSASL